MSSPAQGEVAWTRIRCSVGEEGVKVGMGVVVFKVISGLRGSGWWRERIEVGRSILIFVFFGEI